MNEKSFLNRFLHLGWTVFGLGRTTTPRWVPITMAVQVGLTVGGLLALTGGALLLRVMTGALYLGVVGLGQLAIAFLGALAVATISYQLGRLTYRVMFRYTNHWFGLTGP